MSASAPDFGFGEDEAAAARPRAEASSTSTCPSRGCAPWSPRIPTRRYERGERPAWDEDLWKQIVELGWSRARGARGVRRRRRARWSASRGSSKRRDATRCPLRSWRRSGRAACCAPRGDAPPVPGWSASRTASTATLAVTDARGSWDPARTRRGRARRRRRLRPRRRRALRAGRLQGRAAARLGARGRGDRALRRSARRAGPGAPPGPHPRPDARPGDRALRRTCACRAEAIVSRDGVAALRRAWPAILVTRRRRPLRHQRVAAPDHRRVREDAQAVRPPDRLLPGGEASRSSTR